MTVLHDEELVFELVQAALLRKPATMVELYAEFDYDITQPQLDDAIAILEAASAVEVFKPKKDQEGKVYRIKSESRLYVECGFCGATGFNPDVKRGMCKFCHGNGVVTPNHFEESNGRSRG